MARELGLGYSVLAVQRAATGWEWDKQLQFFTEFLDAGRRLAPHGYCLLWDPALVWTHVISDALIAAAYFSIPVALVTFIRKRRDLEFSWIFWLFAIFIVACGLTHILAIWTLWQADYGVEALVKVVTAIASVGTAAALWPLLPRLLLIPSPLQLSRKNDELERVLEQLTSEVAERQRVEEALRQAQKMEAVGQLTGGIAHDFNNLLQSVTGSLGLIVNHPDSDKTARWAQLGLQAAERGARITGQLLAFSRAQKLELQPVEVARLVHEMRELLDSAVGPQVRLAFRFDAAPRAVVLADPTQLELAIMNLVINARDAMPTGGDITVSTELLQIAEDVELDAGAYLRLSVSDTGQGMPADVLDRAFDPFFTTKATGKGTGLGLSMVYGVARQSGGRAAIESTVGRGTKVSILLRLVDGAPALSPVADDDTTAEEARTILLVDDDDLVRQVSAGMLASLGHRVIEAASGPQALDRLDVGPDLILLDYAMPDMTGAEVAEKARAQGYARPIIFATGFADSDAVARAAGANVTVLRKPFNVAELRAAISAACAPVTTG